MPDVAPVGADRCGVPHHGKRVAYAFDSRHLLALDVIHHDAIPSEPSSDGALERGVAGRGGIGRNLDRPKALVDQFRARPDCSIANGVGSRRTLVLSRRVDDVADVRWKTVVDKRGALAAATASKFGFVPLLAKNRKPHVV